jgi:hypothetical protein
MKQKNLKFVLLILIFSKLFVSCEKENLSPTENSKSIQSINQFKIVDGTLVINNKASLVQIMSQYQKNDSYQKEFDKEIVNLQKQGFRPLTPIFDNYSDEETAKFVKRKLERNEKRQKDFGLYSKNAKFATENEEVIDLSDDLIYDPAFAALLNEDREIIVEEKLYKYTEMGLFITDDDKKAGLDTYLDELTPEQRMAMMPIPQPDLPCNNVNSQLSLESVTADIDLYQAPQLPPCVPQWTSVSSPPTQPAPVIPTYAPQSSKIKRTLPICSGSESSIWDKLFGPTKTCSYFFGDGRCITNKFWNQNFLIFSSLGCKASFEKKKCVSFLWMSTCWWEKSYPERIELGVNSVKYDYVYNVPPFNAQAYNNSTTFFSYNGVNYNQNGQVINTIPTGKGSFVFDTESDKSIFNITVLGYKISNTNFNAAIDLIAKELVDQLPSSSAARAEIIDKMQQNKLKYNVINAPPFSDKVTFITTNVDWSSNSNSITHYFDFNFKLSWNSNMNSFSGILSGLNGATSYKNVDADIYGIAKNGAELGGNRLLYK